MIALVVQPEHIFKTNFVSLKFILTRLFYRFLPMSKRGNSVLFLKN